MTLDSIDNYVDTGVSCPELCERYDVDIREFVVLAWLRDSPDSSQREISEAVGLSPTTTEACLANLVENGLVHLQDRSGPSYVPTMEGIALLRKSGS